MVLGALCIPCALIVAACGGEAAQRSPQPPVGDVPRVAESPVRECDAAGINERLGQHGTCVIGDVTRTVANRRQRLVLDDEIEIGLGDLAVRPGGRGHMVAASLRVRNLGARRLRWPVSARQVALWLDQRLIPQDPDRRWLALQALRPRGKPRVALAPGGVATVAVGWRLSSAAVAALTRRGSAIIVVPPHGGGRSVEAATRIGVLRLWK